MPIQDGSLVHLHYRLTVDGEVVDNSEGGDPVVYTHGQGEIIGGLESRLAGLSAGDRRDIVLAPEEGYGPRDETAVHRMPKDSFREPDELTVGCVVHGDEEGGQFEAVVREIGDDAVTLDLNHPLAGKTLHFSIEIVAVE